MSLGVKVLTDRLQAGIASGILCNKLSQQHPVLQDLQCLL
jgi:hypothetical protein